MASDLTRFRAFYKHASFAIALLLGAMLYGCAGSTAIQRQHHLLVGNPSGASVYFLRPKEGIMGVRGQPIGIDLDGEKLMDLSIGQYTEVDITPGKYDMVVTNWTIEGDAQVKTSRQFVLDVAARDTAYLLFTLEKISYWDILSQRVDQKSAELANKVAHEHDTTSVTIGKYVTVRFIAKDNAQPASQPRTPPGIGYTVGSLSREAALEAASKLERVEGTPAPPRQK